MKKTFLFLILTLFAILLVGCGGDKDKKVVSVEIDQTTIPSQVTAYDFDISTIHLIKKYSDGSIDTISLSKDFLDKDNQTKLNTIGSQTIAFLYENNAYVFSVEVVKGDPSLYLIESIDVAITTKDNTYNVLATTQKNIDIYAEVNTNSDLMTATLSIVISPEFTFTENITVNCTLDGTKLDSSNLTIKDNKLSLVFDDAFWSPLA